MKEYEQNFNNFLELNIKPNSTVVLYTVIDRLNIFLEKFIKYYSAFDFDLYIFVRDNSNSKIIDYIKKNNHKITTIDVTNNTVDYRHIVYDDGPEYVKFFYKTNEKLFKHYKTVVNVDCDEILLADNLQETLNSLEKNSFSVGYDIVQNINEESNLNTLEPIYKQRNYVVKSNWYNKRVAYKKFQYFQNSGRHHMWNTGHNECFPSSLITVNLSKICSNIFLDNNIYNRKHYQILPNNFQIVHNEGVKDYFLNYYKEHIQVMPTFIKDKLMEYDL